jgi:hypothetical protein
LTLYLRPLSYWGDMDPESGCFPVGTGEPCYWDGVTTGAASGDLFLPDCGNFTGYFDVMNPSAGSDVPTWRWTTTDNFYYYQSLHSSGNDLLTQDQWINQHLHVAVDLPQGDLFHVLGSFTGFLNEDYLNSDLVFEVLEWHVSAVQMTGSSPLPVTP